MTATFKVNRDVLKWVVNQTDIPPNELYNEFKKLKTWLSEDSEISVAQIEKLSNKTKIPFGYFFMSSVPKEDNRLADFRTIENLEIKKMSRNLIDVIKEMEVKQAWMRDYLIENGAEPFSFIGKYNINSPYKTVSNDILETLNLESSWNTKIRNPYECYKFLKNTISKAGILVMQASFVGNQTQRRLDLEEFRAFVLIDDYAPLIFINSLDSDTAKLFSIVHELVHIWLGKEEIFNLNDVADNESNEYNNLKLERFCNKVTGEFLLPENILLEQYKYSQNIFELAKLFNVSPHFTAIRLKEVNLIDEFKVQKILDEIKFEYKKLDYIKRNEEKEEIVIPYYNLKKSRYDRRFLNAIKNSVDTGYTNYTEAYTLTGAKGKTFTKLMGEIK